MARTYRLTVGFAEAGLRLDRYLLRRLPSAISRSRVQEAIRRRAVTVNGRAVKISQRLRGGEIIAARLEELPARGGDTVLIPQPIPLEVVYEDASLLVVNKPAGLVTHPAPGHWDGTLVNAILWHLQRNMRNAECGMRNDVEKEHSALRTPQSALGLTRAGIVHRLDKDTSGLLLVAKTAKDHTALAKQLKARTIRRRYLALVEGHLPMRAGTIDVPIGRHLTHRKTMAVRHLGGRAAVTHYRVLRRLQAPSCKLQAIDDREPVACHLPLAALLYSVVEVSLETGRTHQIRVHLAHLGYPVLGDVTYGRHPAGFWKALGIERQLLHAQAIRFTHPATRRPIELSTPLPPDMAGWIESGRSVSE